MNKDALDFVIEKTKELMAAPSCCPELKEESQKFLDSVGTPGFQDEARKFYTEVEEDIGPIDHVIELFGSDMAIKAFGEEKAKSMKEHAIQVKEKGGKYCDCPACTACAAILTKKDEILDA